MKADTIFLKSLAKELRFLKNQEKDNLILEYQAKINEEAKKGQDLKKILASFETPKNIAKKIYDEAGFNTQTIEKASTTNCIFIKSLIVFSSIIPQSIFFILAMGLIISGLVVALGTIPIVVLCWLNFNPIQAAGPSILALGLMPLIGMGLVLIGRQTFKLESLIFRSVWKTLTSKKIATNQIEIANTKGKKIFLIVLISLLFLLTLGGAAGSFATEKTLGRTIINGEFLHVQTEVLNTSGIIDNSETTIEINYQELDSISWYDVTFIADPNMDSKIEINRGHNDKADLKIEYAIKRTKDNKYKIDVEMPWNLMLFNFGGNKFVIRYDGTKFKFVS